MKHLTFSRFISLSIAAVLIVAPLISPRAVQGQSATTPNPTPQPERFIYGESVNLSQPLDADTYVSGGQVVISKDIGKDLVVFGGSIQISGNTKQDLIASGGNIAVNGTVGDDARIAGGTIIITGNIADELMVAGGTVDISANSTVTGDVTAAGGLITVNGNVNSKAKIYGGEVVVNGVIKNGADLRGEKVTINGTIQGGAIIAAREIVLGPDSAFVGDVRYWNKTGALDIATHVTGGTATFDSSLKLRNYQLNFGASVLSVVVGLLWALASSSFILLLLVIFLRGFFVQVEERLAKNFWKDLGIGIAFMLIVPMIAIILMVTIVGIPIGLMLGAGYMMVLYVAEILASVVIALWWANRRKAKWSKALLFLMSFVILIGLNLVQLIPFAGWIATGLVIFAALGSTLVVKWKTIRQYM